MVSHQKKAQTIGKKIFLSFSSFFVLVILISLLSYTGITKIIEIQKMYNSYIANDLAVAIKAETIKTYVLEMRRSEKDFIARQDKKYFTRANSFFAKALSNLQKINKLTEEKINISRFEGSENLIDLYVNLLKNYRGNFNKLVQISEKRGFNEEMGLQKIFRGAAHLIADEMEEHNVENIKVSELLLIGWEKDYLRTKDKKYLTLFKNEFIIIKQKISKSKLPSYLQNKMMDLVHEYNILFLQIIATNDPEKQLVQYNELRGIIQIFEDILEDNHISNGQFLYLTMRKHEKDYMLRRKKKYLDKVYETVELLETNIMTSNISDKGHIIKILKKYKDSFSQLIISDSEIEDILSLMEEDAGTVMEIMDDIIIIISEKEKQSLSQTEKIVQKSRNILWGLTIVSIVLIILSVFHLGRSLLKVIRDIEKNDYFKTGHAQLADQVRGEKKLMDLGRDILLYLAKYVNAQVGTFYIVEEDGTLNLTASYAFTKRKKLLTKISSGVGIVGEAFREKESILITEVPNDYVKIESTLGHSVPKNILATPVMYQGKVYGVMELGSFKSFSDDHIDFLKDISENVAIAIRSAKENLINNELLRKTLEQKEELQTQQEELRVTNEELSEKSEAINNQKVAIEKKNEDLVKAQVNISRKAEELSKMYKYKSEFLANMSHELRTPLNSMLLLSKKLSENKLKNLNARQVESAKIIYESGNNLLRLINEILDLSKIEAGKVVIDIEEVFLGEIQKNMQNLFEPLVLEKGLEFKLHVASDIRDTIKTDQQRLEQILKNLLSNAVKFTEKGSVSFEICRPLKSMSVQRHDMDITKSLLFSVKDTGVGIPENKQSEVFKAFQQADSSTSRKFGGTGLGLSISRELVQLLGGEIQVESEEGKGTTFMVFLPLSGVSEGMKIAAAKPEQLQKGMSKNKTSSVLPKMKINSLSIEDDRNNIGKDDTVILVIEDDLYFAKTLYELCNEKNLKCFHTSTGEQGLEYARQYIPHAIILDLNLPGINGWQVLDELKGNVKTRHIPVHIMSAGDKDPDTEKKGAVGFLTKPVSSEDLEKAFNDIQVAITKKVKDLLVVEDDDNLRKSIATLLESNNIKITMTGKGEEAFILLQSKIFDCIILDLKLPDISGFDLLDKLSEKNNFRLPPVIIYTGKNLTSDEQLRLNKYASSIVIKGAASADRLLDETSLFLHAVSDELSVEAKNTIETLHSIDIFMKDKKVLVVDDDIRNIYALTQALEEVGMQILKATDGKKALAALNDNPKIDIVLMDIMMPKMDGYEAMHEIRKQSRFKNLPIIALTAKAMLEDRQKCIDAGANDYLQKPIDEEKLLSMMRVWMKNRL